MLPVRNVGHHIGTCYEGQKLRSPSGGRIYQQKFIVMAKKLTGLLNLSKIPKELIGQTKKGEKCLFVDIIPNRNGADEYGNTHTITLYNKNTKQTIYLGNLKEVEFGKSGAATPAGQPASSVEDDLPW